MPLTKIMNTGRKADLEKEEELTLVRGEFEMPMNPSNGDVFISFSSLLSLGT